MNIKIRPARAEDAKLLAWCMLMAGRSHLKIGIWDLIISQPEKKCLAFLENLALQGPRHMCYYTEFLVAEVDGKPVAALEGFDPVSNGEETVAEPMAAVVQKMRLTEQDMASGQKALAAFMTCHSDFMEGAWVIEQVAALPEYRRMGTVNKLLEAILDKGRKQGFRLAQVSFYIGNTPAERAYKKAGFKYADEKRHPDFEALIGCPGMVRLISNI
jgi:translation initiation factor 4G